VRYIYDLIENVSRKRKATSTRLSEILAYFDVFEKDSHHILVTDNLFPNSTAVKLNNRSDIESWLIAVERALQWADEPAPFTNKKTDTSLSVEKDHINPSHYQGYFGGIDDIIPELQWLETKQYQNHWQNPENFKSAVLLQADKYLSRLGGKDESVQEIKKGIWYLRFLAAYIANDNKPIRVSEIPRLLGE